MDLLATLHNENERMTTSQKTLNDLTKSQPIYTSSLKQSKKRAVLDNFKKIFKKKEQQRPTFNEYDKAMTCLCFECPKCLNAMKIKNENHANDITVQDIPKLHFITKYDMESGKTLVRIPR